MKLIVGISGASGVELGEKFVSNLPKNIEVHLVVTQSSKIVSQKENNRVISHDNSDISASIASGSFGADAMIILPCSMNTLAKISSGISDNLITRAATVMLKEGKKLILAPREMPFSSIALENMLKLSKIGVVIAPPNIAYYSNQNTLDDMELFLIGKWYDLLNIEHNLYERWSG